ncbi:hypothetical protein B0J14DRAFT_49817 [Halenospora varia]|nr:hypothetical protein B0J14DRAFT_49817 [Halenospora varia]
MVGHPASLRNTLFFGFCSYAHLGTTIHRLRQGYQHIILPIVFLFFPLLQPCQIVLGFACAIRDWHALGRARQPRIPYFLCGMLGMHVVLPEQTLRILDYPVNNLRRKSAPWNILRWGDSLCKQCCSGKQFIIGLGLWLLHQHALVWPLSVCSCRGMNGKKAKGDTSGMIPPCICWTGGLCLLMRSCLLSFVTTSIIGRHIFDTFLLIGLSKGLMALKNLRDTHTY